MTDALEKIIRPIVEGQIRGFLKEHPSVLEGVDWYTPRKDKSVTFVNSLAKRIVRDLVCGSTLLRIKAALLEYSADESRTSKVERPTAARASQLESKLGGTHHTQPTDRSLNRRQ